VFEQRGEQDVLEKVENYVQSHDVTVNFPIVGAKVTLSPKSLNDDEFNMSVKFANGARSGVEGLLLYSEYILAINVSHDESRCSSQIKAEEDLHSYSGFRAPESHDLGSTRPRSPRS